MCYSECMGKTKKTKRQTIVIVCLFCKSKHETKNPFRKYCSRKCADVSKYTFTYCLNCGIKYRNKKKTIYCSNSCSQKHRPRKKGYHLTAEHKRKISEAQQGEKGHNWKGGIYPEINAIRRRASYKEWRKSVFMRDNYTCQICGKRGGELNADHIKSFAKYPELRTEISNGRTLCVKCHRKTDSYAKNVQYH